MIYSPFSYKLLENGEEFLLRKNSLLKHNKKRNISQMDSILTSYLQKGAYGLNELSNILYVYYTYNEV